MGYNPQCELELLGISTQSDARIDPLHEQAPSFSLHRHAEEGVIEKQKTPAGYTIRQCGIFE